ncbi:MAG: glycerol-3-phosphate acyltransferase [Lachnospiraceae bacterium]|nr:glycerol-3-phosphate acyltransferase [Lachnospiraceae bacterium]
MKTVGYILLGYLSGSVLYARLFTRLFGKEAMLERSRDHNPGTANAFMYGGFWCGLLTLICDIGKGFLPVFLFLRTAKVVHTGELAIALVLAAPVLGHVFPVFYRFQGGKGIATTFGCLLGLFPYWKPAVILAAFFIFFSLILRISPHYYRTLAAYFCSLFCMVFCIGQRDALLGFVIITMIVCTRMFASSEEKEKMKVRLLWMH